MKQLRTILFTVFSIFLGYRTIELMENVLVGGTKDFNQLESLTIAFLLSLFVTGVFAFLGFVYKTNLLLPNSYYTIQYPKLLSKMYRVLGVEYFRSILMFTYWGKKQNRIKYFDGTKNGIQNLIFQSKQSEFGHAGAFVLISILSLILLYKGYQRVFLIAVVFNTIGNLYPVILQRNHRMRIQKIKARYDL